MSTAEWQSIETAPKDGTPVIVGDRNATGSWVDAAYYDPEAWDCGGWFLVNTHWTDAYNGQVWPTVWQPFPDLPSASPYKADEADHQPHSPHNHTNPE